MLTTLIIIFMCLLLVGGVFDFLFNLAKPVIKILASIILIIAAAYLGLKLFIVFVPWIFAIVVACLIFGLVWLGKAIF